MEKPGRGLPGSRLAAGQWPLPWGSGWLVLEAPQDVLGTGEPVEGLYVRLWSPDPTHYSDPDDDEAFGGQGWL